MKQFFLMLFTIALIFLFFPVAHAQEVPPIMQDTFMKAKVLEVVKEASIDVFGTAGFMQEVRVNIKNGEEKGTEQIVEYQIEDKQVQPMLSVGDNVVIGKQSGHGEDVYYISDIYRLNALWVMIGLLALFAIFFAKKSGARSFLGLALSFLVIAFVIIPLILRGISPLWASLLGGIIISLFATYVAHGFHARTTIALLGMLGTLLFAVITSLIFVKLAHLTGLGSEDAFYLRYAPIDGLDLRGLLLGGIIIGVLGVLDDVATAQAAAVEEIKRANSKLGFSELYKRGLSVGREHIVSLVNTLVLAYTGASFPLLLLFVIYPKPWWVTLNSELVMEELVRMLVGSIALIVAVPLTTFLAAQYFQERGRVSDSSGHVH